MNFKDISDTMFYINVKVINFGEKKPTNSLKGAFRILKIMNFFQEYSIFLQQEHFLTTLYPYFVISFCTIFLIWDSIHARLNSHYDARSYKKKKHKKSKTLPGWNTHLVSNHSTHLNFCNLTVARLPYKFTEFLQQI